jgi:hypothetical protein
MGMKQTILTPIKIEAHIQNEGELGSHLVKMSISPRELPQHLITELLVLGLPEFVDAT